VDPERARELLQAERNRLERLLPGRARMESEEFGRQDSADLGTEVFDDELDEGIADEIQDQLDAIDRAEQRLADGTYGISIESGQPIPDERLEAFPAAERTAGEQAIYDGTKPPPA
jgi:DnaK suppressor protein